MVHEKKNRPKDGWRQVEFKHFICVPDFKCFLVVLPLVCLVSFILTIIILSYTYQIKEVTSEEFRIQDGVQTKNIEIDKDLNKPVFLYIYFIDFYQNHRIYLKSKSKNQLADKSDDSLSDSCSPLYKKSDIYDDEDEPKGVDSDNVLNPCGLAPRSFMDITVSKIKRGIDEPVDFSDDDISWDTDNEDKYKNGNKAFPVEDKRFKNWMRTSATRNLRKLYSKIEDDLNDGDTLKVELKLDESSLYYDYRPKAKLILSTTTRIGGKNKVLGFVFLVITLLSLIWSIFFACLEYNPSCKKRLPQVS